MPTVYRCTTSFVGTSATGWSCGRSRAPDASGISCVKAVRLLGWKPTRSWRDWLDDGHLRAEVQELLLAARTGLQQALRAIS